MFKQLKGIEKGREEKEKDQKNLEILLDLGDEYIKTKTSHSFWHREDKYKEHSQFVYDTLKDVDFNANDLKSYIFAKQGLYTHETALDETILLGSYTGCLLTLLTRKNKEKGKATNFYINGNGMRFDYLFHCANEIDKLVIHNFRGDCIGNAIAIYGGKANLVAGIDLKGKFIFQNAGAKKGKIKMFLGDEKIQNEKSYLSLGAQDGEINLAIGRRPNNARFKPGINLYAKNIKPYNHRYEGGLITHPDFSFSKTAKKTYKDLRINEIFALTDSINNSNAEERMDKIFEIYKSIEHLLEK